MRSRQAIEQGHVIAKQRAGFYDAIRRWPTGDLYASVRRYNRQIIESPGARRFYLVRIRCLRHEIDNRPTRPMQIVR